MAIIGDKNIKELVGIVTGAKNDKTRAVTVEVVKVHPLYKKRFKTYKKFYVHDEQNSSQEGDTVRIRQSRPLSKTKRRILIDIVRQAARAAV
jgi:small subunit ribosomal protein S17